MKSFNVTRVVIFLKAYKRVACEEDVCVFMYEDLRARRLKRVIYKRYTSLYVY